MFSSQFRIIVSILALVVVGCSAWPYKYKIGNNSTTAQTQWPCTFTDSNGNFYDFTSQNKNTSSSDGFYSTSDGMNFYYFNLCEQTQTTPNGASCEENTQICQSLQFNNFDISCGLGPSDFSSIDNGVKMFSSGGTIGCNGVARSTTLNLLCPSAFGRQNNQIDRAVENVPCQYSINLYIDSACPQ